MMKQKKNVVIELEIDLGVKALTLRRHGCEYKAKGTVKEKRYSTNCQLSPTQAETINQS